jgi:hypothetical protein
MLKSSKNSIKIWLHNCMPEAAKMGLGPLGLQYHVSIHPDLLNPQILGDNRELLETWW